MISCFKCLEHFTNHMLTLHITRYCFTSSISSALKVMPAASGLYDGNSCTQSDRMIPV